MEALKHCPFCGSEAVKFDDWWESVICGACIALGPALGAAGDNELKLDRSAAIAAWNAAPREKT